MKVTLLVVPPGGGETNYSFDLETPDVPREGEYLAVQDGEDSFGALRVLHVVRHIDNRGPTARTIGVELHVEPAKHPLSRGDFKSGVEDFYGNNPRWAGKMRAFPESGY